MGEQVKTSQCDVFTKRRSQSKETCYVNYSRSKTTMRREWDFQIPPPQPKKDSIVDRISAMEFCFLALKPLILMVFRVFFFINDKSATLCPGKTRMADVLSFKG